MDEEDNIEYWKEKALAAEEELRDHQETSAELEAELERELKEKEEQLASWHQKFSNLENDSERTIERLTGQYTESSGKLERLEKDYRKLPEITKLAKSIFFANIFLAFFIQLYAKHLITKRLASAN